MSNNKIECIKQGYQISHEMKQDIIDIYTRSLQQDHYSHKSDYIRHNLEEKYGRCFSILLYSVGSFISHSFLHADDYLLELRSPEHHILAYLLPPSYTPPPLIAEPQLKPLSRTMSPPLYVSRPLQYSQYQPVTSTIQGSQVQNSYPQQYSSYYAQKYYDGYYRRGGYW